MVFILKSYEELVDIRNYVYLFAYRGRVQEYIFSIRATVVPVTYIDLYMLLKQFKSIVVSYGAYLFKMHT